MDLFLDAQEKKPRDFNVFIAAARHVMHVDIGLFAFHVINSPIKVHKLFMKEAC